MRLGRRQAGNPLRRPEIMPRGNHGAPGAATAAGQTAAATSDAGAAAGQPPLAKTLSTNAGTRGNHEMKQESCGNGGAVESVEIQKQDFPSSHRSLEISQERRDSHIPTAPATRRWKSGKPRAGFPLSHRLLVGFERKKNQKPPTASAKKRDTSIEVRKGTFLTRLDNDS